MNKKDFQSDQVVKWCPGCGDYAILSSVQTALSKLGKTPDQVAFISGIGCSSRFPYYMNTYGFHTVHGRAPSVASGLKIANPDLQVWIITGDGDGLSIGGNHLLHILRRNLDVTILLFNNRIYGLTKGQYSPTSEKGKITKSSPMGTLEEPIQPIQFALAAGGTFVARTYDVNPKHMTDIFVQAAEHKGTSFVEILQNCVIFNDKAHETITARDVRMDRMIHLQDDEPLIYGRDSDKGLYLDGFQIRKKKLDGKSDEKNLIVHRSSLTEKDYANLLANMNPETLPTPVGVFRRVQQATYEEMLMDQIHEARNIKGAGSLDKLFHRGDTWEV